MKLMKRSEKREILTKRSLSITKIALGILVFMVLAENAFGYMRDYPPLSKVNLTTFKLNRLTEKSRNDLAAQLDQNYFPNAIYEGDLDRNGFEDLIVFSSSRAPGLGGLFGSVDIFMGRADKEYDHIRYKSFAAGQEDFVDLDQDGRSELIMGSFYEGKLHNYIAYAIYEFSDEHLISSSLRFKNLSRFIKYTKTPNDKFAETLSEVDKATHLKSVASRIEFL